MGTPEATRQRRDPASTRAALESAARKLFADRGFEGARTHQIAALAGVNQAMINYHFGGKNGLFREVLVADIEAAQQKLRPILESSAPAPQRLSRFVRVLTDFGRDNPYFIRMLTREQMDGVRHVEPEFVQALAGFLAITSEILRAGVEEGSFRPMDPHAFHLSLIGSLAYYALTAPARQSYERAGRLPASAPTEEQYVEHVCDLFLRGLRPS